MYLFKLKETRARERTRLRLRDMKTRYNEKFKNMFTVLSDADSLFTQRKKKVGRTKILTYRNPVPVMGH